MNLLSTTVLLGTFFLFIGMTGAASAAEVVGDHCSRLGTTQMSDTQDSIIACLQKTATDTTLVWKAQSNMWVDVPLTDTADYDINCVYKMSYVDKYMSAVTGLALPQASSQSSFTYTKFIGITDIDNTFVYVPSSDKKIFLKYFVDGHVVAVPPSMLYVTSMKKKCY